MNEPDVFSYEELAELAQSQLVRKTLVKKLIQDGDTIPSESSEKTMLLGLLDGMDRQVMGRAKLRADKKRDENTGETVKAIGQLLKSINPRTYRPAASASDRMLPAELEHREFVPGEMDIGIEPLTSQQVIGN